MRSLGSARSAPGEKQKRKEELRQKAMIKHAQRKQYVQRPAIDVQLEKYQQLALEQRNSFVTAKEPSHREGRAPTPGADSEDKLAPQDEHDYE